MGGDDLRQVDCSWGRSFVFGSTAPVPDRQLDKSSGIGTPLGITDLRIDEDKTLQGTPGIRVPTSYDNQRCTAVWRGDAKSFWGYGLYVYRRGWHEDFTVSAPNSRGVSETYGVGANFHQGGVGFVLSGSPFWSPQTLQNWTVIPGKLHISVQVMKLRGGAGPSLLYYDSGLTYASKPDIAPNPPFIKGFSLVFDGFLEVEPLVIQVWHFIFAPQVTLFGSLGMRDIPTEGQVPERDEERAKGSHQLIGFWGIDFGITAGGSF